MSEAVWALSKYLKGQLACADLYAQTPRTMIRRSQCRKPLCAPDVPDSTLASDPGLDFGIGL
jgi:hypothetical protein